MVVASTDTAFVGRLIVLVLVPAGTASTSPCTARTSGSWLTCRKVVLKLVAAHCRWVHSYWCPILKIGRTGLAIVCR